MGTQRVLIIGGGVAGPALALFLRKAGIACTLAEAHQFVENVGGGLSLAPNGMRVLAALGLADELAAGGTEISTFAFLNDTGARLAHADIGRVNGQPMVAMSRARLFEALAAAMREQGIDACYGKRLVRLDDAATAVVAYFHDGTSIEADLVVGADGVRSVVRHYVVPDARADYTGLTGVGGFTPLGALPAFAPHTMAFVFGRRGFFGYSGADSGSALWWSNLFRDQEFTREELAGVDPEKLKHDLLHRFGAYHEPIPSLVAQASGLLQLNVYDVRSLPTWHRGRVVLIGDAAHAVSPSAGQGASLALEDAMYLGRLLRDMPYENALARFERERKPRVERVVAEGRRRGADKSIVGPVQQWIREQMIRLTMPLFARHGDRGLYEYEVEW